MIGVSLQGVSFTIAEHEQAMLLEFVDPDSKARVQIPFTADAWQNFKRHVAADGNIQPIAIAHILPQNGGIGGRGHLEDEHGN